MKSAGFAPVAQFLLASFPRGSSKETTMGRIWRACLAVLLVASLSGAVLAAEADATVSQVYETARAGHLHRAIDMMTQVLRDHPKSAKAHYVMAELYAENGQLALARGELDTAQRLSPGLSFATRDSVEALEQRLAQSGYAGTATSYRWGGGVLIALVLGGVVFWLLLRRRRAPEIASMGYPMSALPAPGSPPGSAPNAAGMTPAAAPGLGSTLAGGLAGGLAAGAGLVAGEAIARHLMGSGEHAAAAPVPDPIVPPSQDDLGGADFGVSDQNWDDDSAANLGSDQDDWT